MNRDARNSVDPIHTNMHARISFLHKIRHLYVCTNKYVSFTYSLHHTKNISILLKLMCHRRADFAAVLGRSRNPGRYSYLGIRAFR
jgi:hypothetical protein